MPALNRQKKGPGKQGKSHRKPLCREKKELRIINGDGANWIQKKGKANCICVLDKFHRNKKLTECIKDRCFLETARNLLFANRIDYLLTCISAQIDSTEDEAEQDGLHELLTNYTENKEAMTGPNERGSDIPETREPSVIHHARLGEHGEQYLHHQGV